LKMIVNFRRFTSTQVASQLWMEHCGGDGSLSTLLEMAPARMVRAKEC